MNIEHEIAKKKESTYVAIDLKSFYASVECVDRGLDPLKAYLVVADESRTDKTICLAVSPALKAFGISGRARLFEVRKVLKDLKQYKGIEIPLVIAKPRMAMYLEISTMVYETYLKYISAEDIHVYSIDECFLDVTHYLSLYGMTAHQLTAKMIREVLEKTGVTATAGIGPNLYLAKIAMDIVAKHVPADQDGVRIAELTVKSYRQTLWDHKPMTDFWRVGPGIARKLIASGMETMGDVARISLKDEDLFYRLFGVDAEFLIDHAWGYEPCTIKDIKNYQPESNSLSSGQVLKEPYDTQKARVIVSEMTELLVLDMVDKHYKSTSFALYIGYDRCNVDDGSYQGPVVFDHYGRAVPKPAGKTVNLGGATDSTKKIREAVLQAYDEIVNPKLMIRRITINANKLSQNSFEQFDLFTDPKEREKEKKLQKTMLEIQKKFGKNAILKGTNLEKGATTIERNGQIGGHKA